MKKTLIIPVFLIILASCGRNAETIGEAERDSLYHDICALTRTYADSMAHATDTATVEALTARYEARLQAINMHYPPSADRAMTEDLNDTIYQLTQRLIENRRKALAPRDSLATDSIANDTLVANDKNHPAEKTVTQQNTSKNTKKH